MVQAIWWPTFKKFDWWNKFEENYFMSLTMCLGSFIAGATSEGGGAIAYPVMTLGQVRSIKNLSLETKSGKIIKGWTSKELIPPSLP